MIKSEQQIKDKLKRLNIDMSITLQILANHSDMGVGMNMIIKRNRIEAEIEALKWVLRPLDS